MSDTLIYHNPHCSTSRATLALLRDNGIHPTIIEYLKTPPDAKTMAELLAMLKLSARELMRHKEAEYTDLQLDNPKLSEAELIEAMLTHPRLIERPVVVHQGSAVIGRPPEAVLSLFSIKP